MCRLVLCTLLLLWLQCDRFIVHPCKCQWSNPEGYVWNRSVHDHNKKKTYILGCNLNHRQNTCILVRVSHVLQWTMGQKGNLITIFPWDQQYNPKRSKTKVWGSSWWIWYVLCLQQRYQPMFHFILKLETPLSLLRSRRPCGQRTVAW